MSTSANLSEDRRSNARKPDARALHWHHRYRENQEGRIHDLSASGFFLEPLGPMPSNILTDDIIWITPSLGKQEHYLSAIVRWRSASTQTHAQGFGLEFDDCSKKIAKNLLL